MTDFSSGYSSENSFSYTGLPKLGTPKYTFTSEAATFNVIAVIGGQNYFVDSVTVTLNAHGATGTAMITFPLFGGPDFSQMYAVEVIGTPVVPVTIYLGVTEGIAATGPDLSIAGKTAIFTGQIDAIPFSHSKDGITLRCRSLAAALVDNRLTTMASNMTTTAFVANVATQYGLNPVFYLPTDFVPSTLADVYRHNYAVGIQNNIIWDTIMQCAELDDCDVWDDGTTLYYAAPGLVPRTKFPIVYGENIEEDDFEHSLYGSTKIRVEVRSGNKKTKNAFITRVETDDNGGVNVKSHSTTVTSQPNYGTNSTTTESVSSTGTVSFSQSTTSGGVKTGSAGGPTPSNSGPLIYKYYLPNLSQEQANKWAHARWRQISMMLYSATLRIPITFKNYKNFSITMLLILGGFPMQKANGPYWPRSIELMIGHESGPIATIECVNQTLPSGQA